MRHWYVVRSHPRAEETARRNLARQGFETYLPRYVKRRSHARRVEYRPAPLFPRYLFVSFDMATAKWRAVLSTIGISDVVSSGDRPLPVPPGVVESIQAREGEDGMVEIAPEPAFRKGDMVRITGGPMDRQIGLFEGLGENDRVVVLLELLGRQLHVRVPGQSVVAYV